MVCHNACTIVDPCCVHMGSRRCKGFLRRLLHPDQQRTVECSSKFRLFLSGGSGTFGNPSLRFIILMQAMAFESSLWRAGTIGPAMMSLSDRTLRCLRSVACAPCHAGTQVYADAAPGLFRISTPPQFLMESPRSLHFIAKRRTCLTLSASHWLIVSPSKGM